VLFAISIYGLVRPLVADVRKEGGVLKMMSGYGTFNFQTHNWFHVFVIGVIAVMVFEASHWNRHAAIVPLIVGTLGLIFCSFALLNEVCRKPAVATEGAENTEEEKIHMDLESDTGHLPPTTVAFRGAIFYGWLLAFMASMAVIGLIPTVPIFVVLYMRLEGPEPWKLVIPQAAGLTVFIWVVFDKLLAIPWPQTYLGIWMPFLKDYIPSL